jgi:uncharacterized protein
MSDTNYLALGRQFLTVLGTQDWSTMRTLVTDDVTWSFPGEGRISGIAEGVDAVIARATDIAASGGHVEVLNILIGVNGAVLSLHNTAKADDGRSLDEFQVTVLNARDGKVDRIDSYLSDPSKIAGYFGPVAATESV